MPSTDGVLGLDTSAPMTVADYQTVLAAYPFQLAIVEAWSALGTLRPSAPASARAARSAGLAQVDIYHYPSSPSVAAAGVQVEAVLARFAGVDFTRYWIDVEANPSSDPRFPWERDFNRNITFLYELVTYAQKSGKEVGIYTMGRYWEELMDSTREFASHPLWWVRDDKQASFEDFEPFGGWNRPVLKQYALDCEVGGVSYDASWAQTLSGGLGGR